MVFPYYKKLSRSQKMIYRKSDGIDRINLQEATVLIPVIKQLNKALNDEMRPEIERLSKQIIKTIVKELKVSSVNVKILAARPSNDWGELHGLYEPAEENKCACISVWMRTARHKKVVAFKTFLRTLLHELCHHLDYELLGLDDSYHTEGFFKRESSLFKRLTEEI